MLTSNTLPKRLAGKATSDDRYRVLLVDDSAVYRGLVRRALELCDDIEVDGSCGDGAAAIRTLKTVDADVVVLDIEMPVMDGLTALPKLIETRPSIKVIMASTLTARNANISLRALQMGAAETVAKPTATLLSSDTQRFVEELIRKIRALSDATRAVRRPVVGTSGRSSNVPGRFASGAPAHAVAPDASAFTLRSAPTRAPAIVAIGSSTGGPKALISLLQVMVRSVTVPIVITQHMPPTFTSILAEHIERATGRRTQEGTDGMPLQNENIYVAPGDYHMTLRRRAPGSVTIHLDQNPPESFCRPAVDPMLRSVAQCFGGSAFAIILTGMGQDGAEGAKALVAAGGSLVAQDEATSVVWGMPQAAAKAGVCSAILPLDEIAPYVAKLAVRRAA